MSARIESVSRAGSREDAGAAAVLSLSEVFGPTFQGEGQSLGRRCTFVRLGACNLHCVWCDTPYTWDWTGRNGQAFDPKVELTKVSATDLWSDVQRQNTGMLVVTGGEPLLQQRGLIDLLRLAREAGWWLEIETAGTIAPVSELSALVDRFNVSPKLANSGNEHGKRFSPVALATLQETQKATWKFVVTERADFAEIDLLVDRFGLEPIWIMPEGTQAEVIRDRLESLANDVLERGWNLTTRLQVEIWGNRRGV